MNLSHVRILAVVSVSFLAIWGFVRARTALERNIHMLNSGVASFTMIDPVRPIGSTQDHVFTYLLQSHIFALLGETQIAADKCTSALQTAKLDKELKKTISALCDARRSIVNEDWPEAVSALMVVQSRVPSYQSLLSRELSFTLGHYYLSSWEKNRSEQELCTAKFYFDELNLTEHVAARSDAPLNDCEERGNLSTGQLTLDATKGCIGLNPQLLDFPGTIAVRLSASDCASANIEAIPPLKIRNLAFNSGLSQPGYERPALAIKRYYENDDPYELASVLERDKDSGTHYISIAPQRDKRPDTLVAGKFRVNEEYSYLVGGIGRGEVTIGCTWWGGAFHGQTETILITDKDWALNSTLLNPPPDAKWCVLMFYNNNRQMNSDLDAIFFAELQNDLLRENSQR